MFLHQIKYEWLQLIRDRWVLALLMIFILLCLFAASNGKEKVTQRNSEIETAFNVMHRVDMEFKANIDSIERGLKTLDAWSNPRRLSIVGNKAPRVAAMQPAELAALSIGQSDLFTHTVKPTIYTESYALDYSELSNPVQLMFGNFDLSFVMVYLLPLLVLAFSYNLLSAEREGGSLRLTLSQPISMFVWLFNKLLLRFLVITGIVWISITLSLLVFGVSIGTVIFSFFTILVLVAIYIFFWFAVALMVNAFGKSSGYNAVVSISIWTILVLLLPAIVAQFANSIYPIPSRINMIHEMRVAKAEAEKRADKILAGYYREHPELAQQDTTVWNQYEFYLGYFASQDEVKKSILPVLNDYDSRLQTQQAFVDSFKFISPSLMLQDAFNELAGTSSRHYVCYRKAVIEFAEEWRSYFLPRIFRNEWMQKDDFARLPVFSFVYKTNNSAQISLIGLTLFASVTLLGSAYFASKRFHTAFTG